MTAPDSDRDDGVLRGAHKVRILWDELRPQHKTLWEERERRRALREFVGQVARIVAFLVGLAGGAYGLFKALTG